MRTLLISIIICLTAPAYTQTFSENFDDGEFLLDPAWQGETDSFLVNASFQLQLQGDCISGGTNYVSTAVATKDSAVWEFFVDLQFDPSATNYTRVYLQSDQQDLGGNLNGYFIKIGEDGTGDVIHLYRQNGLAFVLICDGITNIATSPTLGIKVVRTFDAEWQLYLDATGGTSYTFETAATDTVYNGGNYFGFFCKYTSTRCSLFYFDNINVDPLYTDTDAPELFAVNVISSTVLEVDFNENVDLTSAETEGNYSVDGGVGGPVNATRGDGDYSKVLLTFAAPFPEATLLTLTVNDIADESGNALTSASKTFSYYTVKEYDVLINEIFADFDPVIGLPAAEYLELYNNAPVEINVEGWTISDGSTTSNTFPAYTIPVNGYVILSANDDADLFTSFSNHIAPTNFPGLNNDGDFLLLYDANGNLIHSVNYSLDWYDNAIKQNGGWSLEMIDPGNPCQGDENWTGSENVTGGTPGEQNSVFDLNPDETSPGLLSAYPYATDSLVVYFDEPVEFSLINTSNFSIDHGIGNPTMVYTQTVFPSQVKLFFENEFLPSTIYTLTVTGIADCSGNIINALNTTEFGLPEPADTFDLVINEILFNPVSGGFDFIELYNRSAKIIDLSKIIVAEASIADSTDIDELSIITTEGKLIFPGEYIVLTESVSNILSTYLATDNGNFYESSNTPGFSDAEGIAIIYDQYLNKIDQLHYYDDWHYELLADKNGVSLERVNYDKATQNQSNWHSAASDVGYATPGYQNSVFGDITAGGEIGFEYNVFSPDGDGYHDLMIISYTTATDGFTGNFKIYDAQGRIVKELLNNELLSRESFITWDGVDDDSREAPMGIYILYAEIFNLNGQVEKHKMKFTLVRKQ
jgi:hypothetical protein